MQFFITQNSLKLIKNVILLHIFILISSCNPVHPAKQNTPKQGKIALTSGKLIDITLSITPEELSKGLSGIRNDQYADNQGMLFYFKDWGPRAFWMPDTYFDLDIFYLDDSLKIIDVARKVKHHPSYDGDVPRAKVVYAKHVLELKSDSPLSQELSINDKLIWISPKTWKEVDQELKN